MPNTTSAKASIKFLVSSISFQGGRGRVLVGEVVYRVTRAEINKRSSNKHANNLCSHSPDLLLSNNQFMGNNLKLQVLVSKGLLR